MYLQAKPNTHGLHINTYSRQAKMCAMEYTYVCTIYKRHQRTIYSIRLNVEIHKHIRINKSYVKPIGAMLVQSS